MPAQSAERERPSLGDKYFVLGLTAILCFAVLTTWVPSRWPVATAQIATYSLGLAWIVRQWLNPRPIHGSWLLIPTAMAAAWGPFQLALGWTVYRFATISKSLDWLACFVVFFLAIQALHGNSNQRLFQQTILWFGLIISALSVLQYFTSEGKIFWVTPSGF